MHLTLLCQTQPVPEVKHSAKDHHTGAGSASYHRALTISEPLVMMEIILMLQEKKTIMTAQTNIRHCATKRTDRYARKIGMENH